MPAMADRDSHATLDASDSWGQLQPHRPPTEAGVSARHLPAQLSHVLAQAAGCNVLLNQTGPAYKHGM